MAGKVEIFDSTLRDGAQGEGISFSVEDKLNIVRALDALGVAYIEAGNPGSNPKDLEFFERVRQLTLHSAKLCAFGSTRKCGISVAQDENLKSLLAAGTPTAAVFGKTWDLHVQKVIRTTLKENLAMVRETVEYLKQAGREVIFDAEHFFDGCKSNEHYAMEALRAACEGGADVLCLCDTNGGTHPRDIYAYTKKVVETFGRRVAIHCHNDTGLAVAGSLYGVEAGACQVQGTFTGFGERCGNANLSTVIPDLQLKEGIACLPPENLPMLTSTAHHIAEIANLTLPYDSPYVGKSAFAHKGGMHIDGVSKLPRSFEHVPPESVGNERRFLMSEVSGRTTVLAALQKIDPSVTKNSPETRAVMQKIKQMEHFGYQFEGAQASVDLLIRRELGLYRPFFKLEHYKIIGEQPVDDPMTSSTAVIKVSVDGKTEMTAAQGDGPVHALDCALRKALTAFYPQLAYQRLTDYKVRVMEPQNATASKVRVLLESTDGQNVWANVGVSSDIIEASWIALCDSVEYKLTLDGEQQARGAEG